MESSTFDTGAIVILAAIFLIGCLAIRSWIRNRKPQQSVPEAGDASLAQLTTIVQQQQAAIDKNAQTLEGVRRSLDDQAAAVESISGAVDTARSEAATRDEAMRELIGNVHGVAAAASENAENALLTAGGLRRKLDEVGTQAENIPPLRNEIQQLQQNVTAIAEAMPRPDAEQPARERKTSTNARKTARKTAGRQTRRGKETPAGEATPTAAGPPETDAPASAGGGRDSETPPEKPPTATAAPDPGATRPNGKPAPAAPPAAGTTTADADKAADESADGSAEAPETGGDDAGEAPPATRQTEATQ